MTPTTPILDYFKDFPDPRQAAKKQHLLEDVIAITLCAIISNVEGWDEIALYGREKQEWLKTFLQLPYGIPSHDTFNRVFSMLDPKELGTRLGAWLCDIRQNLAAVRHIAIDGKSVRRSLDTKQKKKPLHLVSAWADEANLLLGQVKTSEKSNEITAIPELLDLVCIRGAVVTIDAMGCQKEIAEKILTQKGDYVFNLKANHAGLHKRVAEFFDQEVKEPRPETKLNTHAGAEEQTHGRVERRHWYAHSSPVWMRDICMWPGIKSISMVEHERLMAGELKTERRYYLSSLPPVAQEIAQHVRRHWGIENRLHWTLDVLFREDDSRKRAGHAAQNFAYFRRFVLNLLRQEPTKGLSLRRKRLKAGWDNHFLEHILGVG